MPPRYLIVVPVCDLTEISPTPTQFERNIAFKWKAAEKIEIHHYHGSYKQLPTLGGGTNGPSGNSVIAGSRAQPAAERTQRPWLPVPRTN
jgi:hypothetical protein